MVIRKDVLLMKIDHKEYMRRVLNSKKMELEQLVIAHRINLAVFETKSLLINKDIDSLEQQLTSGE